MDLTPELFNPGYAERGPFYTPGKHPVTQWIYDLNKILISTQSKAFGQIIPTEEAFSQAHTMIREIKNQDGSIWWVGNGGSCSLCSHFSQDLANKQKIKSLAFTDASLLTCQANDFGYENAYARMIEMFARSGDMLIAISSSGESKNILKSIEAANKKSIATITLSAFENDNKLFRLKTDLAFYVPSRSYGLVETAHSALLHGVIDTI
ncbi:MAG: SIS domain-containing protein [Deltaproteobacteria bacterium]|nr:MAG: SIS domain-containing protein [Deltaproteobacteria bacterium]